MPFFCTWGSGHSKAMTDKKLTAQTDLTLGLCLAVTQALIVMKILTLIAVSHRSLDFPPLLGFPKRGLWYARQRLPVIYMAVCSQSSPRRYFLFTNKCRCIMLADQHSVPLAEKGAAFVWQKRAE